MTDFPERFESLQNVLVKGDETREFLIEGYSFHKNRITLKFRGVDSIDDADLLRNMDVCVRESEAVELEEDEFFDWDLEGCAVVTKDGVGIGTVTDVFRAGENVNLVVAGPEKEHMIPFVKVICPEVDIDSKKITVDLPEGLLEF